MTATAIALSALAAAVGLLLGYLLGWHRGLYRLPIVPGRRRARSKPPATPDPGSPEHHEAARRFVESRRARVAQDLAVRYPYLSPEERQTATDEILRRGHALRVRGVG